MVARAAHKGTALQAVQKLLQDSVLFQDALRGLNELKYGDPFGPQSPLLGRALGLVRLVPGIAYESALTAWNDEERVWWQLLGHGDDAYSARVQDAVTADVPERVALGAGAGGAAFQTIGLCTLAVADAQSVLGGTFCRPGAADQGQGALGNTWLQRWGLGHPPTVPVVVLPLPMALAVVSGKWHSIMLQARTTRFKARLFPSWPGPAFFRRREPQDIEPYTVHADAGSTFGDKLRSVANHVRMWAPSVLTACLDDEERAGTHGMLESDIRFLEGAAAAVDPAAARSQQLGRREIESEALIECLRIAQFLTNAGMLDQVVRNSLRLTCPPFLAQALENRLNGTRTVAKRTTIFRSRLAFDAALALTMRDVLKEPLLIYMWADSSPQGGHDWLLSHMHYVVGSSTAELLQLAAAVDALASRPTAWNAVDGVPVPDDILLEERAGAPMGLGRLTWQIFCAFRHHCPLPGALGSRAGSLQHKCATLLHALRLECHDDDHLESMLDRVISITTDMGTEIRLTEVVGAGFWSQFESHLQRTPMVADDGNPEAGEDQDMHSRPYVFSRALPIAGLLHILDNLTRDVQKHMDGWPPFQNSLRAVCNLLCKPASLEVFMERCLRQAGLKQYSHHFDKRFPPMIDWRWSTLMTTLSWLLPLEKPLRQVWDPARYGKHQQRKAADGDGVADVREVTAAIRDDGFWLYACMSQHLQSTIEQVGWWARGCPCHSDPLSKHGSAADPEKLAAWRYRREQRFARILSQFPHKTQFKRCPMEGKRAPELACGRLDAVLEKAFQAEGKVILERLHGISEGERDRVLRDWSNAQAHFAQILDVKLGHWTCLPWLLAGLAHHSPCKAREAARACIDLYDQRPDPGEHHRVSIAFLNPGSQLRADIEQFARGALLSSLSGTSVVWILSLKFIPVCEAIIEGAHGMVHQGLRGGKKRKRSAVTVSLASGRFREFEARLQEEPRMFEEMSRHFARVRNAKDHAQVFRFMNHPRLQPLWQSGRAHHTEYVAAVTDVMYHLDPADQYRNVQAARVAQIAHDKRQRRLGAQVVKASSREAQASNATREAVVAWAMHAHFQERAKIRGIGYAFSLPVDHAALADLPDLLRTPLGQAPASCDLALQPQFSIPERPIADDTGAGDCDTLLPASSLPAGPRTHDTACLKLVRTASNHHTVYVPPGGGRCLTSTDMVVTLHREVLRLKDGQRVVINRPAHIGHSGRNRLGVLSAFAAASPEALAAQTHEWELERMMYCFLGLPMSMTNLEAATAFVASGAVNPGAVMEVPISLETSALRESLSGLAALADAPVQLVASQGFLETWRCTETGARCLECCEVWCASRSIFALPEPMPSLMDLSTYGLIMTLERAGFLWRGLPKGRRQREALGFRPADAASPKVWCSRGLRTSRLNLLCLSHGAALVAHGVGIIVPGLRDAQYREMLQAAGLLQPVALSGVLAMQADDGAAPLEIQAEGEGGSEAEDDGASLLGSHVADDVAGTASGTDDSDPGIGSPPLPPLEEAPPPPPPHAEQPPPREDVHNLNYTWGVFRLTLKRSKPGPASSGYMWQCACPFHRLSHATGCSKAMAVPVGPWQEQSTKVELALKAWALRAPAHSRQREHMADAPIIGVHAEACIIEARCIRERPPRPATDAELDASAVEPEGGGAVEPEGGSEGGARETRSSDSSSSASSTSTSSSSD